MQKASETRLKFPYQWSSLWILCLTTDCLSLLCFSVFVLYSGETVLFSCVRLSGLKPWAAINDQSSNTSCHNRPGFWPRCNRCRSNAWRSSLSSTWHYECVKKTWVWMLSRLMSTSSLLASTTNSPLQKQIVEEKQKILNRSEAIRLTVIIFSECPQVLLVTRLT